MQVTSFEVSAFGRMEAVNMSQGHSVRLELEVSQRFIDSRTRSGSCVKLDAVSVLDFIRQYFKLPQSIKDASAFFSDTSAG